MPQPLNDDKLTIYVITGINDGRRRYIDNNRDGMLLKVPFAPQIIDLTYRRGPWRSFDVDKVGNALDY